MGGCKKEPLACIFLRKPRRLYKVMVKKASKVICFLVLVLMLGIPSLAQNTKGDKPAPTNRESRFKTPKKSSNKSRPARRIKRQDDKAGKRAGAPPSPTRTRKGERPGKPVTPQFSKSSPRQGQRPWKGDITGRRIKPRSSSSRAKNVYPQPEGINYSSRSLKRNLRDNDNPNVRRVRRMQREDRGKPRVGKPIRPTFHKSRPQESQRTWRGDITGRPIRARRSDNIRRSPVQGVPRTRPGQGVRFRRSGVIPGRYSGRARNIFSGRSFYVNNQSRKPPRFQERGNRVSYSLDPNQKRPGIRGRQIRPRSASAAYMSRLSTNTWAHFPRPKRGKAAVDRDLAGHRLRGKNFETQRPELTNPTLNYRRRIAAGERPYKGPAAGGYVSRTRSGQRAWKGDVARRAIRGGKPPKRGERAFLGFLRGGGFQTATKPGEMRPGSPLKGRAPGLGAKGVGNYQGNIRANQRRGFGNQGEEYTGNIRARRPLKGGGSVSGRVWNNKGFPIQGRTPGQGSKGIGYQGNIRAGKRAFNDQGEEYSGNIRANRRRVFSDQGEEYTGNIKSRRPDKGGGSRGGPWNNNNTPILVRTPKGSSARIAGYQGNLRAGRKGFSDQGEEYSGNIKARRPDKGGGSVSGKLWNNNEQSLPAKGYLGLTKISRYSGNIKARRPEKGGGSVSGKLWNNDGKSLPGKDYSYAKVHSRYSGNLKAKRPEKGGGDKAFNFEGNEKFSRSDYKRHPKSNANAMPGRKVSAAAVKADQYARGARRSWDYIKNPSSADAAQRTREPGRAFGRSADFQGNVKVRRYELFGKRDLHPDARFVKLNKNNVPEEKDMLTNFKLWWARLFKKSETQPDHLKEKGGKPRYDKGESGLWYE